MLPVPPSDPLPPLVLCGSFDLQLDDQSRLTLPDAVRKQIDPDVHSGVWFAIIGMDGKLWLYPERYFESLAAKVSEEPVVPEESFARIEPDKQGRILLPEKLIHLSNLRREVTFIGVRDHLEIWNRGDWEQERAELQERFLDANT